MTDRIEKTVDLKATPARVWRALTDHEEFGSWFRVRLDQPFEVGETSTGHMTLEGYEHVRWHAIVEAIEPESRFAFRWYPAADNDTQDYRQEVAMLVEFRLVPEGEGTRLTVTESGFDKLPADQRESLFKRNEAGWTFQVGNIREHVEAG